MEPNQVASVEAPVTEVAAPVVASQPEAVVNVPVAPEAPVSKPKRVRKPKAEAKPVKAKKTAKAKAGKVEVKRGRGRPIVFKGNEKKHIVSVIRKHGLTKGRAKLAEEQINISLPTLGKFAAEAGIELHRGRPAKAA